MAHEHNRDDRNTYVKVQYKLLADWEDIDSTYS
jgi:hypothetical protein